MLTYRTNVLLDEKDHAVLSYLSSKEDKTISELVRHAVKITYSDGFDPFEERKQIIAKIKKNWKLLKSPSTPLDYKKLAHYGHKY